MAKKLAKAVVAAVAETSEDIGSAVVPSEPVSVERIMEMIAEGQAAYEEIHGEGSGWVPRFIISEELANALLTRNAANRFPDQKIIDKYTKLWLSNRLGEDGEPIKGTMKWETTLPISVDISDEGNLHNGQKCLRARNAALAALEANENDVRAKKAGVTDLKAELGITPDMLELVGILRSDFAEDAADYIDTAQQRTNADLGYRRKLFAGYDFSFHRKTVENASPEATAKADAAWMERLPKIYNKLAKEHNTVLNFICKRIWGKGAGPRDTPSNLPKEFSKDMFVSATKEFPQATDSVFFMHQLLSDSGTNKTFKAMKVSLPYVTTAHFLASMHDAKFNKKTQKWERSKDGKALADAFVHELILGKTPAFKTWRDKVSAMESKGDKELKAVFFSLCHLWRHFAFEEALSPMQVILAGTAEYPTYSAEGGKDDFDKIPVKTPTQAEVDAMQAAAKQKATAPTSKRPNFAKK